MTATLIVALDLDTRAEAEAIIEQLGDAVDFYKIGYQCFYGADGFALGKDLLRAGKRVFFDLKLLDIDNTIEKGVAAIAATGATMLTVHAYPQCMRAAVKGAAGSELTLLGVSVLTSMNDADVAEAGFARDTAGLVALRAEQAKAAGIGGLVSSPLEAEMVRNIVGPQDGDRHPRHPPGRRCAWRPEARHGSRRSRRSWRQPPRRRTADHGCGGSRRRGPRHPRRNHRWRLTPRLMPAVPILASQGLS